jgi:hypothetical protein
MKNYEIIAKFMGLRQLFEGSKLWKVTSKDLLKYYPLYISDSPYFEAPFFESWNWLMPACNKWGNLKLISDSNKQEYVNRCHKLMDCVSRYDIEAISDQLVDNIKWYYLLLINNK